MKNQVNRTLRTGLLGNAAFSLATGLALLIFSESINTLLGLNHTATLRFLGGNLIVFSAWLILAFNRSKILAAEIYIISALDALWATGSLFILTTGLVSFSAAGVWIVGAVALVVAIFMTLQVLGLRRHEPAKPNYPSLA